MTTTTTPQIHAPEAQGCVLFSIVETSSVHQYTVPLFWGSNAECEAEREKRSYGHTLKVCRMEDLHKYSA